MREGRRTVFTPLGGNGVRLFLTSATLLFVELLLIRWIPANVTYIGFFSNFLLMASFLGIGLGILLGRNGRRVPILPFALLLLRRSWCSSTRRSSTSRSSSPNELFFGLAESHAADTNFLVLPLVVVLVTGLMATLALPLGPLLKSMPPLRAYAIDIAGSMAGIAAFTLLSAAGTDPLVWFARRGRPGRSCWSSAPASVAWSLPAVAALLALVVFLVNSYGAAATDIWSPYYRITTYTDQHGVDATSTSTASRTRRCIR